MLSRRFWTLVVSLSLVFLSCPFVQGQSTYGSIAGSVTDPSGAAMPGAQVALPKLGTAEKRTQPTGADGLCSFVNLLPGNYRIEGRWQGCERILREPVVARAL